MSGAHRFTKADVVLFCGFQFLDISQILQGEDDQAVHLTKIDGSFQWVWTFLDNKIWDFTTQMTRPHCLLNQNKSKTWCKISVYDKQVRDRSWWHVTVVTAFIYKTNVVNILSVVPNGCSMQAFRWDCREKSSWQQCLVCGGLQLNRLFWPCDDRAQWAHLGSP